MCLLTVDLKPFKSHLEHRSKDSILQAKTFKVGCVRKHAADINILITSIND